MREGGMEGGREGEGKGERVDLWPRVYSRHRKKSTAALAICV
jgi:hypothetical protein